MQMSTEEERLRISLREERKAVKNLTGHVDEYLSAKNNYSNELNHLKEENKKLEMHLENQTAEMVSIKLYIDEENWKKKIWVRNQYKSV